MIETSITGNLEQRLGELNTMLGIYAGLSRRSPEDIVTRKAAQVLLGIHVRGQTGQPGLFALLSATAPSKGSITAGRISDSWRVGDDKSASLSWARMKARELLGGQRSGAFRVVSGDQGGASYIARVQAGKVLTRGRRRGQVVFGSRSRTANAAVGVSRAAARAAGGVVLNYQALAAALAVQRRERSRGASAAQFLPGRYRQVLRRRSDRDYRGGQAVGINSVDSAMIHRHERVLVENRKGRALGSLEINVSGERAAISIRGELGLHTPAQRQAIDQALQTVMADTLIYIATKNQQNAAAAHRAAIR